ncbi:MAG: alpha-amylase family glycosyl hydrolase [bacterium]
MRSQPKIYELHAPAWLHRQARRIGRPLTLATVPDEVWSELADLGFGLVWVMGVWKRSPASRALALTSPARQQWQQIVPDLGDDDILGSPYAIHDYSIAPGLGDEGEIAKLRAQLNRLGLRLVLDFVPNHLGCDHPWVTTHPWRLLRGSDREVVEHPDWFFGGPGGAHFAHGRDPNFPPWRDTVQVDYTNADARAALAGELARIAELADGIRIDLAMLGLNRVVARTWGELLPVGGPAQAELWSELVARARKRCPSTLLIAEAYWGLEPDLLELGFDFAYDKTIYDLLLADRLGALRAHLGSARSWLARGVHFVENHDEERAQVAFGRERARAATVVMLTLPGMPMIHDGQLEGAALRAPIHLARAAAADELPDEGRFQREMLELTRAAAFTRGTWSLLHAVEEPPRASSESPILAWRWRADEEVVAVAVNWSAEPVAATIELRQDDLHAPGERNVIDLATHAPRGAIAEMATLRVELGPWEHCILALPTSGA